MLALAAISCDGDQHPQSPAQPAESPLWLDLTIGGIPAPERGLLVLASTGFLVDVSFPVRPGAPPDTLSVRLHPWSDGEDHQLAAPVARRSDGATFRAPRGAPLEPGSYTIWATVDWADGVTESVSLAVAVRTPTTPAPLAGGQWIQLDFEADRDGDGIPDFPTDLAAFGLAGGLSASVDMHVESWVIDEIVQRSAALYRANPSGLPEGDPLPLVFSADAPEYGPYTRICVAGESPDEAAIIGNVLLDPGNSDRSDEACDDYLPSGVFPREIRYYEDDPGFQAAFAPLLAQPAGAHTLDPVVVSRGYDASDPAQKERRTLLARGVETFAQVVASVTAHEAGHAMGLVPPGAPGAGLFGGRDGADFTHNLTTEGAVPAAPLLMNPGPSFSFDVLAGGAGLLELRPLNFAYLQGRVILDPRIDGIHPPPRLDSVSPTLIWTDGPLLEMLEIEGGGLQASPTVILHGPADFLVVHAATVTGRDGAPDKIIGNVLAPKLLPGFYDLELTNADGQHTTLPAAIEVR